MVEPAFLVGAGGMVGAVSRYLVSEMVDAGEFPSGTLTVNLIGSFALGFVTFFGAGTDTLLFIGTGACGAFTTFSSFSYDTVRLWETDNRSTSVIYAIANIVGALVTIGLAWLVVQALSV